MTIRESRAFGLTDMRMTINRSGIGIKGGLGLLFFCLEFYLVEKNIVLDLTWLIGPGGGIPWKISPWILELLAPGGEGSPGSLSKI